MEGGGKEVSLARPLLCLPQNVWDRLNCHTSIEFSLNVFTEFTGFSDKNNIILKKRARTHYNRADPYIEPNSYFSDFSDSLNSLNSVKVLLHLGKTPMIMCVFIFIISTFGTKQLAEICGSLIQWNGPNFSVCLLEEALCKLCSIYHIDNVSDLP